MTAKQKKYIEQQLNIIQNKLDEDDLSRYAALLSCADLDKEVLGFLVRAVDMRRKELNPIDPMVVNGDLDDVEGAL